MRNALILAAMLIPLGGCTLTPEQEAWNRQHHVGEFPWRAQPGPVSASPFNGKDWADPHPHSDSDDQQRAAFEANQQRQRDEAGSGPFSTDGMNCTTTTSFSGSANSGTSSSHTSCH